MPNVTLSPNMGLPVPTVSVDPGPDWATNVDACLEIIDGHNHSPGSGVQITPAGINIVSTPTTGLSFNNNNAVAVRSVRFMPQSATLALPTDIGAIYESGVDLYYNDGNGNIIRITQSGSVTGATGTITGLPSGTASVTYSSGSGTYTFQSATNTPANMAFGPFALGTNTVGSKTITFSPNSAQAANYNITYPAAAPASGDVLISDSSGNLSWVFAGFGQLPIGSVIATFPNLTGAYTTSATTAADAYGFVLCEGQTIVDATSPMNGQVVPNINNDRVVMGFTTAGTTGGSFTYNLTTAQLPSHTHGPGTYATSLSGTFASPTHTHNFAHAHQSVTTDSGGDLQGNGSALPASTTATGFVIGTNVNYGTFGSTAGVWQFTGANLGAYSSGALAAPSGSGATATTAGPSATSSLSGSNDVTGVSDATGSGSSITIVAPYFTAVYLMRIK